MFIQPFASGTYTDLYQITMAQVYFNTQRHHEPAVFDYFFRKLPFKGGFVVFAGLSSLLDELESLHFSEEDIHYLRDIGFQDKFLEYLKDFRFRGQIYSSQEEILCFPLDLYCGWKRAYSRLN